MSLTLHSSAFTHNSEIPTQYTCQGQDITPPLQWDGVPSNAQSLVLIVDDPDAPDPKAPKMTWVHWVLYNIPTTVHALAENRTSNTLPFGTKEGINNWNRTRFGGPCPPIGMHRYFFKLYALDTVLSFATAPTKAEVLAAMQGHLIESIEMIGRYQKK